MIYSRGILAIDSSIGLLKLLYLFDLIEPDVQLSFNPDITADMNLADSKTDILSVNYHFLFLMFYQYFYDFR